MSELKLLESPKIEEEQAIKLVTKHFPIEVQTYIQSATNKTFLKIWEKLGEPEGYGGEESKETCDSNNRWG